MKKIVLAGGTGFLGTYLAKRFREGGDEVVIISRSRGNVNWNDRQGIIDAVEHADLVVNLAGKSVNCRYNEGNKKEIFHSRLSTTRTLGECIAMCVHPPRLWINSSTATIYRHAMDRPMTENDGEIGTGFSVEVAKKWEAAFFGFSALPTRQVALRMAIVLGNGGVMKPLKRLTRLGLGGRQGKGDQMFSWIHIEDVYQIIVFMMQNQELKGVFNCAAPNPVSNQLLMHALRKSAKVNLGLPCPAWLLEIGAVLIRTETELILKSRWVLPGRLLQQGFHFRFPTLETALQDIIQ